LVLRIPEIGFLQYAYTARKPHSENVYQDLFMRANFVGIGFRIGGAKATDGSSESLLSATFQRKKWQTG
jgi:hypothetical protein